MNKEERREYNKKYSLEHKEEKKERNKKYRLHHKDESKKYRLEHKDESKKYYSENKEERKEYNKKYHSENKEEINVTTRKWRKNKHDNDPIFKRNNQIRCIFKSIINKIVTNDDITAENDSKCLKLFGTTVDGFKKHIENQFTGTMSWYNHGPIYNPTKWQVDHIIPIVSFDFTVEENFTKAFHYTNTRPLMSSDHMEKSNKEQGKYDK